MKKKSILILLIITVVSVCIIGCGSNSNNSNNTSNTNISFDSVSLEGTKVDSSLFKESSLTMINIWATYCPPCIAEIPDIQDLYVELKEEQLNVNIIGIVSDTPSNENENKAISILESSGVDYINIIPDQQLLDGIFQDVSVVPTTIFVDSEGNIVDEFVLGARSKDEYKKEITDRLSILKK